MGKIWSVWHTGKTDVPKLRILLFVSNLFPPFPPFSAQPPICTSREGKVEIHSARPTLLSSSGRE